MIKKQKNMYPYYLVLGALIIYTVFFVIPVVLAGFFSFTDWNIARMDEYTFNGLKNFKTLFQDEIFLRSLGNSMLFAFCTTILKTVVGLGLALIMVKKFRGNSFFRTLFYLPCVLSTVVIGVLFTAILKPSGLFNNALEFLHLDFLTNNWLSKYSTAMPWIIIIETWMWSGFCMFIFISGLQAIPKDYYECASMEGATPRQQFFRITLPLLMPSFTVVTTLNITGGLKVFDLVYVLTNGGPGFDTQVVSTYSYRAFGMGLLGESSAAAILLSLLVVVLSFGVNRYLKSKEVTM